MVGANTAAAPRVQDLGDGTASWLAHSCRRGQQHPTSTTLSGSCCVHSDLAGTLYWRDGDPSIENVPPGSVVVTGLVAYMVEIDHAESPWHLHKTVPMSWAVRSPPTCFGCDISVDVSPSYFFDPLSSVCLRTRSWASGL